MSPVRVENSRRSRVNRRGQIGRYWREESIRGPRSVSLLNLGGSVLVGTASFKSAARRWGEDREREWFNELTTPTPVDGPIEEVPTLTAFAPRFIDGHARANRQKPGGIAQKETVLRVHLLPQLGPKRLDAISTEDVQRLKHHLRAKAVKTVNNVLTVLNTLLKKAVEWQVIPRMPCTIRLLKVPEGSIDFYDFDEYE